MAGFRDGPADCRKRDTGGIATIEYAAASGVVPAASLVGGAGMGLSGFTGSYVLTLVVVAVSGIGVAAHHPESARVPRLAGRDSHTAMMLAGIGETAQTDRRVR